MDTFFVLRLQMFIQLKPQHLAIFELELEHLAIEPRIVLEDDAVVVLAFQFEILKTYSV